MIQYGQVEGGPSSRSGVKGVGMMNNNLSFKQEIRNSPLSIHVSASSHYTILPSLFSLVLQLGHTSLPIHPIPIRSLSTVG